jgi:RNA polymerase sigma-70 factor (ECF subfamily)
MELASSEREAVSRARGGDASAYGMLVRAHQEAAFRAAYLILHDAQAAEDVTQEGFVRAYQGLASFREEAAFRPWLLRIVTNLALNQVRSRGRGLAMLQRLGGRRQEIEPPAEESFAATEEARTVWQALNRLDPDDRLILYLRYFLEQSEDEMARVIGKAPGTVKSRLHRAGRRLRGVIEREFPELRLDS